MRGTPSRRPSAGRTSAWGSWPCPTLRARGAAGSGCLVEPRAVVAVVRAVRSQAGGERQMTLGLAHEAGLLAGAAEAEVGEVVDRVALHDGRELLARLRVTAAVE